MWVHGGSLSDPCLQGSVTVCFAPFHKVHPGPQGQNSIWHTSVWAHGCGTGGVWVQGGFTQQQGHGLKLRHSLQVPQHPAKARGQWGVVTPCHTAMLAFPLEATLGPARGLVTVHTAPFACLGGLVLTHCSPPEGHLGRSSGRTPGSRYGHMLPMRRDSGQPHHFSPKDSPAQAFTLRRWASLGQPKCRGCILTNPSIPVLGYGMIEGARFY